MDSFDSKLLRQIAHACRKAGISEFKGFGIEIKLADSPLPTRRKKAPVEPSRGLMSDVEVADLPTNEELLYWSVGGMPETDNG